MVTTAGFRQDSEALGTTAAANLTADICDALTRGYDEVLPLILRAFRGRAWVAMGNTSWEAYCAENFTASGMLRLPDDMVSALAGEGLSVRAIAAATGRSKSDVHRLARDVPRNDDNVVSLDGRRRPAKVERTPAQSRAAHPAGKGQFTAWEMVEFVVVDAGERGATYVEICAELGWRDGKVTGALSECSRRGRLVAAGERDGNTVWIDVPQ